MTTDARHTTDKVLMEAGGLYTEHNPNSFTIVDAVPPILRKAATSTESLEDNSVFTYCDFGTADGGVGGVVAKAVVDHVKSINNAKSIHIVYQDQAENDFSPILANHQHSVTNGYEDVLVSIVGRSFYKQCLPPKSVNVSFSSLAAHWPDFETDAVHDNTSSRPMGASLKWRNEHKDSDDWERFLAHRAHELKKNGQLVVVHFLSFDPKGTSPCDKAAAVAAKTSCFIEVFEELQKEGRLKSDENFVCPAKFRTSEELKAPFLKDSSAVRKAGLTLCSVEEVVLPCLITEKFRGGKLSPEEYGRALTLTGRSWSESIVFNSLNADRSKEEKQQIVEEVYARMEKCITAKVPNVGLPSPVAILVAEKDVD